MKLSAGQRTLLGLMRAGYRMVVVRSPVTMRVVHAELVHPERGRAERPIPLWRLQRLLNAGVVRTDTGNLETARELCPPVALRARTSSLPCLDADFPIRDFCCEPANSAGDVS